VKDEKVVWDNYVAANGNMEVLLLLLWVLLLLVRDSKEWRQQNCVLLIKVIYLP